MKNVFTAVNCTEHFLLNLASAITGCISISAFTSLLSNPIGITRCSKGLKICAITVLIKK